MSAHTISCLLSFVFHFFHLDPSWFTLALACLEGSCPCLGACDRQVTAGSWTTCHFPVTAASVVSSREGCTCLLHSLGIQLLGVAGMASPLLSPSESSLFLLVKTVCHTLDRLRTTKILVQLACSSQTWRGSPSFIGWFCPRRQARSSELRSGCPGSSANLFYDLQPTSLVFNPSVSTF